MNSPAGTGISLTRIINLSGSLAFGNVQPNTAKQLTFTIQNSGNSTLTVSSISYPAGFSGNWSGGTIAAGSSQVVTVTFAPPAAQTYKGTVTVNSDKTGGINTISISGTGLVSNYTISGYVRDSANNLGMSSVSVNFGSIGTVTTDSSGYYSKSVSSGWSGTVTVSKTGYSFTPLSRTYSSMSSDQSNQDYLGTVIIYTISGYVKTSSGSGVSGVTLNFSNYGGTAATDASGYYNKVVNYNWNGTATPVMAGYTFSPASLSYSNLASNQSNQNYTATPTAQPNISVSPKSLIITPPKSARSVRENTESSPQVYQLPAWDSNAVSETGYATGLMIPEEVKEYWKNNTPSLKYTRDNFPASKDWSMYDSPVKQQGSCGSCWTFSTTALIENLANQAGLPVEKDFAEQVLVSCTVPGSCGCQGGWTGNSLNYVKTTGLPPESCYPYKGSDPCKIPSAKCEDRCSNPAFLVKIKNTSTGSLWGTTFTVDNLKGVLQDGPVLVVMWVPPSFGSYTGGVYHYTGGTTKWTNYDQYGHAVLLVGYNDADRSFKVKNSWGTYWGEGGYFRISYDDISTAVKFGSYAIAGSGVYIESQTTTTSFTIANTGSGNLTINSMTADKSWLDFSPQTLPTLLPGDKKTISVSVKDWNAVPIPGDVGKITISSNDPDEPSVIVQVSVSKPLMASQPFLTVSPPFQKDAFSLSDGKISIDVFSQSGTTEVGISNSGEGTLSWTTVSNSSWLNVIQGSTGTDIGTVSISYNANSGEARTGTIIISSDGATNSPFTVEIRQGKSGGVMGDIDNNNAVDLADAILALQIAAGLNPPNVSLGADVNNDNKIGLEEVIYILQKVAGLR